MNFDFEESIQLLERTPATLKALLTGLSDHWLEAGEGENTWTPVQVAEHLVMTEKTNWIPRMQTILRQDGSNFPPFDRFAHLQGPERPLGEILSEFQALRTQSIATLRSSVDPARHLRLEGYHPALGTVKLRELLATWTVHDLTHLAQIVRVLAKRYSDDVGPWKAYLGVLKG